MRQEVREIIACPVCHSPINDSGNNLECRSCKIHFNVIEGIPILFPGVAEIQQSDAKSYYVRTRPWWNTAANRLLIQLKLTVGETRHDRLKRQAIFGAPQDSLILNLGSGVENVIYDQRFINFDIYPHRNADIVGDAHFFLPFLDNSLGVVWMCAVLEHLRKPWLVCDEIWRILRPGGRVLTSVPFIQKGHGAPHDYFRYTPDGLRSLFDRFEEVECDPSYTRPTGTLVHIIGAWSSAIIPGRLGKAMERILNLVLFWLVFIDLLAARNEKRSWILSGGSCYLGTKPGSVTT
jgi:SAM-dependent methyltransferase